MVDQASRSDSEPVGGLALIPSEALGVGGVRFRRFQQALCIAHACESPRICGENTSDPGTKITVQRTSAIEWRLTTSSGIYCEDGVVISANARANFEVTLTTIEG